MEEDKVWPCSHISNLGITGPYIQNWAYHPSRDPNHIIMIHSSEMFCKYCGASRPKEEKSLGEILSRKFAVHLDVCEKIADTAREYFWKKLPCPGDILETREHFTLKDIIDLIKERFEK